MGPCGNLLKKTFNCHLFPIFLYFCHRDFFFFQIHVYENYCKTSQNYKIQNKFYLLLWSRDNIKVDICSRKKNASYGIYWLINTFKWNNTFKMLTCFTQCSVIKFLFFKSTPPQMNKLITRFFWLHVQCKIPGNDKAKAPFSILPYKNHKIIISQQ